MERQLAHIAIRAPAILDSVPTPLIMVDTGGTIVLANAEAESLFSTSREQLTGRQIEDLIPERFRHSHCEQRRRFRENPAKRTMGESSTLFACRSDGSEVPVEILLNPVSTEDQLFVIAAVIDVTERKRQALELLQANAALEKANMECQQFAYIASHDLQSPLRAIAGFAQLLQKDYQGKLDPEADKRLDRIVAGIKHLQQLIDDMRSFTSVESRARPFLRTDLNLVLDQVLETLAPSIADANAKVTSDALPSVDCDRTQIAQLFRNLIANAIKFHGEQPPEVHISAEQRANEWVIAVRDNGIGIAPKHHDNIFKMFRRLHTQDQYPGTGIGLPICRRIADRHGGHIWLESEPGKGSTFYFSIAHKLREAA